MASSTLPLSLLAKGIGQVVSNGHEKLEVYLEPEDYYNLKSFSPYHVAALQEGEHLQVGGDIKPFHIHKTFVTRKGALLIFSEELANKAIAEQERRLNLKRQTRLYEKQLEDVGETSSKYQAESEDSLRTVHDLRLAILMYGNRTDYRKRGDDLYLRFMHEAKAPKDERKIRPGFSPKRYITAWSKNWQDEMLQKMRASGLVQDKTIYRQNPLLPHLYQPASCNLSTVPQPYRVTKNMLHAADAGNYDYRRSKRSQVRTELIYDNKEEKLSVKDELPLSTRKEPPPSTTSKIHKDERNIPKGSIQAVRFLESGEIQEVKYSELKPQEKQEILAELLATAWEHGKHIEEMLDLVLASNKPRTQSAASSSAASELMMDMHRAILSLAESPVPKQIRDKQQILKSEQDKVKKKQEKEEAKLERKNQRKKKREEREAQIEKEEEMKLAAKKKEEETQKLARQQKRAQQLELNHETELIEQQKQTEHDEKEKRREARREARQKKDEQKAARRKEKEEIAKRHEEEEEHRLVEEKMRREELIEEERRKKEERREERRRLRTEKKKKLEQDQAQEPAVKESHYEEKQDKLAPSQQIERNDIESTSQPINESSIPPLQSEIHQIPSGQLQTETFSQNEGQVGVMQIKVSDTIDSRMKSRPTPSVPNNTPATQQRTTQVQRQFPLETVIYEAKSKRSQASSSTKSSSSTRSRKKVYPPGSLVSAGDGEYAHYTQHPQQQIQKHKKQRKFSLIQQSQPAFAVEPAISHASSHSSKPNVFLAVLPGDSLSSQGNSSFYGGAMPITSNIVKQTLSDNISILSASKSNSIYGSIHQKSLSEKSAQLRLDAQDVPVIGVEPPTPVQNIGMITKQPTQSRLLSSPIPSNSTRSGKLKKVAEKESSTDFSNESDDEPYLSDQSSRSIPKSQRDNDDAAVNFTKKSSTTASGENNSEVKYRAMKGFKGPGSQSSAATLSKTGSKKSSSITRGSLPNALLKQDKAAIYMPDQQIVEISPREIELSSTTDDSNSVSQDREKLSIKPSLKTVSQSGSSVKSSRRVSFQEEENVETTEDETQEEEEETESEEESEKDGGDWPQVPQDTRPISSRSAKLTEHAQKVAQLVVATQRPDSRLDEDATEAVKIWNKLAEKPEDADSSDGAESEEESEEEDESSAGWNANQVQEEEIVKSAEKKEQKKEELKKKPLVKEIVARKPAAPTSVKSYKSTSSGKTSISSVQEAFVKEVKRKASELGINETNLQFDAELVEKVLKSTVEPDEVVVFHDTEAGKHVVRSRHSSVTTKSYKTDTTDTSASHDTKNKQKLVIDMPVQEITARSASPQHSVSTSSSTTASPTSPTKFRTLSQSSSVHSKNRKSSIPVDGEDVSLEYELISYERKLGDPKPEEPVTVKSRPKLEPEKLDPDLKEDKVKSRKYSKDNLKEKQSKGRASLPDDITGTTDRSGTESISTVDTKTDKGSKSKQTVETHSKAGKKVAKKGKGKDETKSVGASKKQSELTPVAQSPEKHIPKTPEVPFVAGRAKQDKVPKGLQPPETSTTPKPKKGKKSASKQEPKTQIELEEKIKTKVSDTKIKSKKGKKENEDDGPIPVEKKTKTPDAATTKVEVVKPDSEIDDDEDQLSPIPAATPEDDYIFVRVEETPEPSEPEIDDTPAIDQKTDDEKSQMSDQTAPTETTEKSDNSEELLKAAEDEAENEAKLAKKKEKEEKRMAGAEKRRLEVERKRREKEEQLKKEKEEQERQEQLKEELENERKRRTVEMQMKRAEAEREKEREKEEEILRQKREEQQKEREKRLQEEHKKKLEEIQRKKKEEEARKAELATMQAEEDERARKEEEEMMAQMAEDERIEYERRKEEDAQEKKRVAEERRKREIEEAQIAMEQARIQAIIRAKQMADLEEKLKFVREFFVESNGMEQAQNVNKAFSFSYFELLQMLEIDMNDINFD